jgi:glycosyltransferase involved in cell wall biosynthesis
MPRILRIINRLNLGGPTYNAAYLSKFLAPEFETMLVAGIKEDTEESSEFIVERMGLQPVYIPEMRRNIHLGNDRTAYLKIKQLIKSFRPDIVHTHAAKAGTLGRLAALNMQVPVVIHTFHGHVFHSYFSQAKTIVFKNIERYLCRRSTGIVAISEIQKEELCEVHKICKPEKVRVIPLGFDLHRFRENQELNRLNFRQRYGLNENHIAVSIIGRIVPVKNHTLFVNAFDQVRKKHAGKIIGFIVGDGEDRESIIALAQKLGMAVSTPNKPVRHPDLIFTSWIKDIEEPLAGSDIVAMTSLNEGTPVSLIEAQAAGKPVATTEVGGIANVVIPGKTALLSPPGETESFARNLDRLISEPELRKDMAQQGWPFVEKRFHYERLVQDMRGYYSELLEK